MTTIMTETRDIPGPPRTWLFGNQREFSRDQLNTLDRWAAKYGDFVSARFGRREIVFVNHPDAIEQVLVELNRKFIKHYRLRQTRRTLGQGLLTSEGDFWREQRKLAQPAFHRERIKAYGQCMVDFTERMIADWRDGQIRDIHNDMMHLTLEIVAKTLFDAELGGQWAEASRAMETLMECFVARTGSLITPPDWMPTPVNLRVLRAIRRLESILAEIIKTRRTSGEDRGDLLSMLLHAQDEESGRSMSDQQLRDEVMTLFMAGHETTANTLAWAWFLLARNPTAERALHAELDLVLGDRPPCPDDLPRLKYAGHVIAETLRLYPPGWMLGREAIEPVEVGGRPIAKGVTVFMPQWVVHRDPRWYDDPLTFRPERWGEGLLERIPRYAYFPFGGGPRICIGNNFALMETVLVLAAIARKFRPRLVPGAIVRPLASMTLRPAKGVPVVIEARAAQ